MMIYSNACGYAIRAMSRLSLLKPEGYVLLGELCDGTELPKYFVAKIFQDLVRKGLLVSVKGRGGGFALARKASQITLFEIVDAVDGAEKLEHCVVGLAKCDDQQPCPQHDQWKAIRNQLRRFLTEMTLEKMSRTLEQKIEITGGKVPGLRKRSKPLMRLE